MSCSGGVSDKRWAFFVEASRDKRVPRGPVGVHWVSEKMLPAHRVHRNICVLVSHSTVYNCRHCSKILIMIARLFPVHQDKAQGISSLFCRKGPLLCGAGKLLCSANQTFSLGMSATRAGDSCHRFCCDLRKRHVARFVDKVVSQ